MGMFDHLVNLQHAAVAVLFGSMLTVLVTLFFLSGRGKHGYDGTESRPPISNYGDWIQEANGYVPVALKLWIIGIATWAVTMTGIVIHHGFFY